MKYYPPIFRFFTEMNDDRQQAKVVYKLSDMIILTITSILAGAEGWREITYFGEAKMDWLKTIGDFETGIPPRQTLGRIIGGMCPKAFQRCFIKWMNEIRDRTKGKIVAVDGKTLRHAYNKEQGVIAPHMVSAFCVQNKMVLGQVKTNEKSNEITAIPELIDILDIRKCLVTIDAIGCQTDIAKKIISKGGDYLFQVKANQQKLLEAFEKELSFDKVEKLAEATGYYETNSVGHGRTEQRQYFVFEPMGDLKRVYGHWEKISKVGVAVRFYKDKGDEGFKYGVRYYITSKDLTPEQFGEAVRGHWQIEGVMHWALDVSMREDDCKIYANNAAENLSTVRRAVLNLLKEDKSLDGGVKAKQKMASYNDVYLARVLAGCGAI